MVKSLSNPLPNRKEKGKMNIEKIAEYTRQNTGTHFLDSGGESGRQWQQALPSDAVSIGEYGAVMSLTHLLADHARKHNLHDEFYAWADDMPAREPWFDLGDAFMIERGYECKARDNTYNEDSDLDQDFVYEVWVHENDDCSDWIWCDDAVILIYPHCGADARGGYASPLVCTFPNIEYALPLDLTCSLYSNDLTEDENERLDAGYSSYPMGELEDMGYKYLDGEGASCRFKNSEGKVIEVSPESRIQ
jgi:hypothetical protein